MRKVLTASLSLTVLLFAFGAAQAGEVTVKGAHLCCGACVKGVDKALTGVDGVSNAASDRGAKTITFTAANDKAAKAGIAALADAGFHGQATHDGEKLAFPASGAKKGAKADKITLSDVHLCCGGCVNGVKKALAGIDAEVSADRGAGTVTLEGSGIDVNAAIAALNKAGFHATVKK